MTGAVLLQDDLHSSRQAQHFGNLHHHIAWQVQHFIRVVLHVFANCSVRAALSSDDVQIAWQAWDIVRVPFCVTEAVFGADQLCVEYHFAWQAQYLGHSTLYTPLSTLYALHFTLYTCHSPLCALHSTLYTVNFTLHTLHPTVYIYKCRHSTLYTPHFTLYNLHLALDTLHYTLHFYTLHSIIALIAHNTSHFTFHFTLDS